ncbi:putative disease resistance RPP13-like protein 1 [Bidens hawaiensis]|uniref:putative disease resistance RPP13-like protein 1 n=1 Tax=Bidens hawaiensis TaxID=980011 RepID=UPI004049805C
MVDVLAIEAKRRELSYAGTSSSRVLKYVPSKVHSTKYALKMGSKLKKVTQKLDDLYKRTQLLGLVERPRNVTRRFEETSKTDEKIVGREGDKEALLVELLGSESSSSQTQTFKVVSIVGMGGIGKTTLAQLLYNNEQVQSHFEIMAWIYVSDDFDVYGISKAVYLAVGGKEPEDGDISTLNLLQLALERKLSNKKFLVVLDDIWNEDDKKWRTLKRPFSVGSSASRFLVTTQNAKVASAMNSIHAYPLELLSDEDALSLFVEHASWQQNFDWNQALQLQGKDIIKKCDRLPLALRALGRVFRTKSNHEDWEELLNSEIWKFDDNNEVIPALKLSYYDLPADLKRVFKYCCLFPKDYMFEKDELVLLWMEEGYLCNLDEDKPMEVLGGEYFAELVSRSFFQRSTDDISR